MTALRIEDIMHDLVIRNGTVLDGTGNPGFRAAVGVRDGRVHLLRRTQLRVSADDERLLPGLARAAIPWKHWVTDLTKYKLASIPVLTAPGIFA